MHRITGILMTISLVALYFTGLGQLPIYQRYYVTEIPGFAWSSQFYVTLQLHYFFAVVLIFVYTYELVMRWKGSGGLFAGQTGPTAKGELQQPSARLLSISRVFVHLNLLILIVTGMIKVIKNLPAVDLAYGLLLSTTLLHNLATVLLLVSFVVYFLARKRKNTPGQDITN